jgi:hypothetical protein
MGRLIRLLVVILLIAGGWAAIAPPSGPRSLKVFDPDRVAALELDMWQAYYKKEKVRLFRGLVTMLHEQNRYSWVRASQAGFYLARAAATFGDARSDYERVLPDLEKAYTIEREWMGASFDPAAVAKAELAWWVARRVPGQNSAEQVGALIARENALIFGVPDAQVLEASTLRARAGRLRDEGGENADWPEVSRLLVASYRELHRVVNR